MVDIGLFRPNDWSDQQISRKSYWQLVNTGILNKYLHPSPVLNDCIGESGPAPILLTYAICTL